MDIKGQPFDYMQYMYSFVQNPIIRGCIRFNGKLQDSKLRHAIEKLALTYPILLCKYKVQKGTWVTDSHASCEDLLTIISAKNDFSTLEIDSLLTSLKIGIDLPLKIYWICGEEKDSLCIIASHLLCDGRGFEQLLYLLAELYSGTEIKEQINRDRSFSQVINRFSMGQKIRILCSKTQKHSSTKLHLPLNESSRTPNLITKQISISKLEQYRSCTNKYRPSINDILLAAYLLTLHDMFRWNNITIPCPVDLRKFSTDARNSICNLTGNYYCHINLNDNSTFEEICREITTQMHTQKNSNSCLKEPMLLHILYHILPLSIVKELLSRAISVPVTSYTNLGKMDEKLLVFQGVSISDTFIATADKPVPYFQLAASTYKDKCTLSVCTYASGKSFDVLCSVVDKICSVLENLT